MAPSISSSTNGHSTARSHHAPVPASHRSDLFSCGGTAVITGGDGCIGLAIVEALVEAGVSHVISLQLDKNTRVQEKAAASAAGCTVYECDQRNPEAVDRAFPQILADGHSPSIFVSCAGLQRRGSIAESTRQDLEDLLQVNTTSQFILARDFSAYRKGLWKGDRNVDNARRKASEPSNGKLIFIASMQSYTGGANVTGYATSKAAVLGTVRAFSNEFGAYNIQTNAIAPGLVDTDFTAALKATPGYSEKALSRIPAQRWGYPEDYQGAAVYLSSRASNYSERIYHVKTWSR